MLRVKTAGKAQAKRLRARSFLLELIERAALSHVVQRFLISDDDILIRGGGGFLVRLRPNADHAQLERLEVDLQGMLWDDFGGELQFALGWAATPDGARAALERRKRQSGRSVLQSRASWAVERRGEPMQSEYGPDEIDAEMKRAGFTATDHVSPAEQVLRYLQGRNDIPEPPSNFAFALFRKGRVTE